MDNYVEISLHDAESGEEFTMTSPEDAVKATNGISEDTVLLSTCSSNNVTTLITDSMSDADIDANKVDNDLENLSGDNFKWSNEAVLLLLEQYRQYEKDMYSGKITHKKTWEKISQVMNEKEYVVTGRQCSTRFNTMKRTYKGVKDHNKKSGNNKRTWPYFEIMDSLLEAKPYMAPLFTLSLTAASSIATENPVRCSSSCCNSSTSSTMDLDNNVPHKRKRNDDIASAILESRAIAEKEKERRHRERIQVKVVGEA
ncbi:uncharacterized protein LOC105191467 isoform X2 [Harpegnathos saltator]|uniref:uncharacterized protein LOC105191467 isoform X2 n=1 Tax=Harpegnathos saltator TaxID=610380 RepID=UPI000DBEE59D|nr:uncharacterized protein LOC105191467 isoform X2 [Harpegnathos saltator]